MHERSLGMTRHTALVATLSVSNSNVQCGEIAMAVAREAGDIKVPLCDKHLSAYLDLFPELQWWKLQYEIEEMP